MLLFVTSSDLERDSIVKGHYNYSKDVVQTLGMARYDNLVNDAKKEILFIPTWRRKLDTADQLVNSHYFKYLNSFLNNKELINYVEKEIETLQNEIASLKSQCEDPDVSSDYTRLSEILEEIKVKEEAQWSWDWYWFHTLQDVKLTTNDRVYYKGIEYKIMAMKDYSDYGHIEYHCIKDWQNNAN